MIPAAFEYVRPASFPEAFDALADPGAKVIAGGQSLLRLMKRRIVEPTLLVDVGDLPLRGIEERDGQVWIGALTTYDELLRRDPRITLADALVEAAAAVGDLQVRNVGTIGGVVAPGDPAADAVPAVLALDARFELCSATGERTCPAAEFFRGPYATALEHGELLVGITIPSPQVGSGSAYVGLEDHASGLPIAGAAAVVVASGVRFGITSARGTPFAAVSLEEVESRLGSADGEEEEYAHNLALVVAERAFERARARAGEAA